MMEAILNTVIHTIIYLTFGSLFVRSVVSLINREIRAHRARKAYNNMIKAITLMFEEFQAPNPSNPST
jgi:hypothetical protein